MPARSPGSTLPSSHPSAHAPRPWLRRFRHLLLATMSVSLLSIGQAIAEETPEPAPSQASAEQAAASPKAGRNGKVCQLEDVTGSRMKKRICYTPEQWAARERSGKQMVRELDGKLMTPDKVE